MWRMHSLHSRQHKIWCYYFKNSLGDSAPLPPSLQMVLTGTCYSVLPSDSLNISSTKHTYWHADRNIKFFSILSTLNSASVWKYEDSVCLLFKLLFFSLFFFFAFAAYKFSQCLHLSKALFPFEGSFRKLLLLLWNLQVPSPLHLQLHISFPGKEEQHLHICVLVYSNPRHFSYGICCSAESHLSARAPVLIWNWEFFYLISL